MRNYLIAIIALLVFSCQQKEETKIIPVNMSDTIATEKEKAIEVNKQLGDTIRLSVKDEKGNYSAVGEIDSLHPRIYVKFVNDGIGKVKASIKPETQGNIRFNQIIFPDKTADGPFGVDIEQELKQTGEHTLIISHSLMAENPYFGKFRIELQLENN